MSARHGVHVPHAPGCEFAHARVIEAPRAQVFAAIADASRIARWWGPEGFRNTIDTFEFRQGGRWLFTMHGPDGTDYPNENRFAEISAPGRVVIEHVSDTHHFHLVIGLEARRTRTRVTWRQVFDDAAHATAMAAVVRPANEQNLTRLAAEVQSLRKA